MAGSWKRLILNKCMTVWLLSRDACLLYGAHGRFALRPVIGKGELRTWSGVMEKAGMGMIGMDSRCGAMALRMMLRKMPAASS